jgi:hypothetical protein
MSLTRKAWVALVLSIGALAAGCSTEQKYAPAAVNAAPIIGDEAMALRSDWPKSVSYYANGSTQAYSTRFPYDAIATRPGAGDVVLDPVMFIAQVLFLPVELVVYPPFKEQVWYGERVPPTYTAQPPLPPLGGAKVPPVSAFPFLGPQATTPDTSLPGAPATPASGAGEPQLRPYPAATIAPAAAPTPPPFSPGSSTGPPVAR